MSMMPHHTITYRPVREHQWVSTVSTNTTTYYRLDPRIVFGVAAIGVTITALVATWVRDHRSTT